MSDGSQQDKAPSAWKRFWLGLDEKGEVVVGEPIAEVGEASSEPSRADENPTMNVTAPVTTGIVTPRMNFVDSVVSAAQRSFNWKGRASRPAYWWVVLAYLVIVYGPLLIGSFTVDESSEFSGMLSNAMLLVWVLCLPAIISVAIRRLHDSGRSGWVRSQRVRDVTPSGLCAASTTIWRSAKSRWSADVGQIVSMRPGQRVLRSPSLTTSGSLRNG